jgi:flagellar protein FliJ
MKYKFSFQKVLDFKEQEQETAKQEFGSLKSEQLQLEERIEELGSIKEKAFNQYDNVNRKTVMELLEIQQGIDHFNHQMKRLEDQSQKLFQKVEEKQQVLIEKTQEAKIWNQWKDKSRAAFHKQMELKEQATLDELAVLRYSRRT